MHSLIVRIYRHERDDPRGIVGTVEFVENGTRKSFRTVDELARILLNSRGGEPAGRGKTEE